MCFGCSKEPSQRDGSFKYPQHMFWLRNKKNNFQLPTLIWGPDLSYYIYLNLEWEKTQMFYNVDQSKGSMCFNPLDSGYRSKQVL